MRTWTKVELINRVKRELDLEDEVLIQTTEMNDYLDAALDDCEAIIHSLDQDYFLRKANIALVSGTAEYSLPADIYASKIRRIRYNNGSTKYTIHRLKRYEEFEQADELDYDPSSGDEYKYLFINTSAAAGVKIQLHPPAQETHATAVTVWYLRNVARMTVDADPCDIPEFANYLIEHMKRSCLTKENLGITPVEADIAVQKQEALMIATLGYKVPDDNSTVAADLSAYEEHN